MEKTVLQIHFEDRSGTEFERLVFAFVARQKGWDKIEWLGQTGSDKGRDIWGEFKGATYCYQCANYRQLNFKKVKGDIDKLVKDKNIPNNFMVVCGGRVTVGVRDKIVQYGKSKKINLVKIMSGVEFEESLRKETPELLRRFVEGEQFPDAPKDLIKLVKSLNVQNDANIIDLLAECLDRPAFTTRFNRESSIPNYEKALNDTIEVLNTGIHRLRDGTVIRTIPSRHRIGDRQLKSGLAEITKLVVDIRDNFIELKSRKEIKPCECGLSDCPVYMLSDNACRLMDKSRQEIFKAFKKIKPDFNLKLY